LGCGAGETASGKEVEVNRAQRRAQGKDIRAQIKTQVFNQEKDSLRRHLKKPKRK